MRTTTCCLLHFALKRAAPFSVSLVAALVNLKSPSCIFSAFHVDSGCLPMGGMVISASSPAKTPSMRRLAVENSFVDQRGSSKRSGWTQSPTAGSPT